MKLIKRITCNPASFELTELGKSFLNQTGSLLRVENLRFVVDVVFRGFDCSLFADKYVEMGNGVGYYLLRFDGGVIQLFYDQGIAVIILDRFEISSSSDYIRILFDRLYSAFSYLYHIGVVADWNSLKQVSQEYAYSIPQYSNFVNVRKARVSLNRKALGLLDYLDLDAKAWVDRSYGALEVESNDLTYTCKLLLMPEILYNLDRKLAPILEDFLDKLSCI